MQTAGKRTANVPQKIAAQRGHLILREHLTDVVGMQNSTAWCRDIL